MINKVAKEGDIEFITIINKDIVYLLAIYDKSSIEMINEDIVFQEIKKFIEQEGF